VTPAVAAVRAVDDDSEVASVRLTSPLRRVLAIAVVGVAFRLFVAATTYGTYDVHHWTDFIGGAMRGGPLGIYEIDYANSYYNHGPLTSWILVGLGELHRAGLPIPFLVRLLPSLADGLTTVLVFLLLRPIRGDRTALIASAVFAFAPVTIIVSGFHGNTDPILMALVLLAAWSLRSSNRGWPAGVAFGLAVSVKVVPIVGLPLLLVWAGRRGRATLGRFVAGGFVVFLALWVPVLATHGQRFVSHVLLYSGVDLRQWGFSQAEMWAGIPESTVIAWGDHLRFPLVVLVAAVPAVLASRRDDVGLIGLPFCAFLLLSPAFSMQYLVWAAAPALLLTACRYSVAFVASASLFALTAYSVWNEAPPWAWHESVSSIQPPGALYLMVITWLLLARVCWWGLKKTT
jgi:4-amino-4-deoxy-L-arabinose transferase-like glycosyltransferase